MKSMIKWDVRRGDIIYCDLGLRNGSVQSGIRPCVVVSNDINNIYSTVYIVVPLTSQRKKDLPTHVEIADNSYALCEQVTTVSEQQILRKKGYVNIVVQNKIDDALRVAMDL